MSRIWLFNLILLFTVKSTLAGDSPALMIPPISVESQQSTTVVSKSSLTLEQLQAIAMKHNPSLSVAAARYNAAQGKQFQAGRSPNPIIGYHATQIGNQGTEGQQGGFIAQQIVTGGKLQLDEAVAGQVVLQQSHYYSAQQQRVLTDVQIRFFETLAAQRKVELTERLVEIGDAFAESTQKLVEGRQRSPNDLLQAQIQADQAAILLDNARNEFDEAWRRLKMTVGIPMMEATTLDGELEQLSPPLDWEMCSSMVIANHPELNAAIAKAEQARISITRAKREPIPNIDFWVSVRDSSFTDDIVTNVQIGVPIPIFDKNRGNIRASEANWIEACQEIERIKLLLQDRLAVIYRRYANAVQQQNKYREKILPRAEKSLSVVRQGYESGQVEYLTLLNTQQIYVQANLTYLNALRELHVSRAILEGQLLDSNLDSR